MFKFLGTVLKGIGKGVVDVLPIPKVIDAIKGVKINDVINRAEHAKGMGDRKVSSVVGDILDILDDGKLNHSVDAKRVETISRIVTGSVPALLWLINGLINGNWLFF